MSVNFGITYLCTILELNKAVVIYINPHSFLHSKVLILVEKPSISTNSPTRVDTLFKSLIHSLITLR